MIKFINTVCYLGFFPLFPGTFASIVSLLLSIILFEKFGLTIFILLTIFMFFTGWWSCEKYIKKSKDKDPSEIVIDEWVGQWISIIPIFYFNDYKTSEISYIPYLEFALAFIIFRLFDIFKIGPVLWADSLKSGLGIMLDDVIAGGLTLVLITTYITLA